MTQADQTTLMSLQISELLGFDEAELTSHYIRFGNACIERKLNGPRDDDYYHLLMLDSVILLQLLGMGQGKWKAYSMTDAAGRVLDYFERANTGALNGREPRQFIEYLLDFKQRHDCLENDIDTLLTELVDRYPNLGRHNFADDPAWFDYFVKFAKGLRHRSMVYAHGKPVHHFALASKMKDLYYDQLALLIGQLRDGIEKDAEADKSRGRLKLSAALCEAAGHFDLASRALQRAWSHCCRYIDDERKRGELEHIFDAEIVKHARVDQFVRSYLMTLRMRSEFAEDTNYLSLLEGIDYHQRLAVDPGFEAKIDGLIGGLELVVDFDAARIERELNALIGRDVWTCQ